MPEHIDADGKFQSDKYPTTPAGFVPLKVSDKLAQDLLMSYADRRRELDPGFSEDLITCLAAEGYGPALHAVQSR